MRRPRLRPAWIAAVGLAVAACGASGRPSPRPESSARNAAAAQPAARTPSHAAACVVPPHERTLTRRTWLSGVTLTEYYPVPERWFRGRRVAAPGLAGTHHVDFLYSARGLSMEGDGIDLAGRRVHIQQLGSSGWVNAAGRPTRPPHGCGLRWTAGPPYWRAGGWRNRSGAVTFPLAAGGWSAGAGRLLGDYGGVTFGSGPSLPLRYYRSVATDPHLIPRGSRIYIPAYRGRGGGWFVAQDTGGAIIGRHIDVYRPPPASPADQGALLRGARVYVIPPGA